MPQVLVRDVEPAVMEKLRAQRNGRSLKAEARVIFRAAVVTAPSEMQAEVERVRALFTGRVFSDSAALLREDRER